MKPPPIGIKPQKIWLEDVHSERKYQLRQAIMRYIKADLRAPPEWGEEYMARLVKEWSEGL